MSVLGIREVLGRTWPRLVVKMSRSLQHVWILAGVDPNIHVYSVHIGSLSSQDSGPPG